MKEISNELLLPLINAQKIILKSIENRWNELWKSGKNTLLHSLRDDVYLKICVEKLTKREQVAITRLRIGHSKSTHQYLLQNLARLPVMNATTPN